MQADAKFIADFEKPGEFICACAVMEQATMVVMGSRGMGHSRRHSRRGSGSAHLGSCANYVVQHAECPVLTVKSPKKK